MIDPFTAGILLGIGVGIFMQSVLVVAWRCWNRPTGPYKLPDLKVNIPPPPMKPPRKPRTIRPQLIQAIRTGEWYHIDEEAMNAVKDRYPGMKDRHIMELMEHDKPTELCHAIVAEMESRPNEPTNAPQ